MSPARPGPAHRAGWSSRGPREMGAAVMGQQGMDVPQLVVIAPDSYRGHRIELTGMADRLNKMMAETVTFRDRSAVARFFDGLDFVEPGLVQASKWRPASESEAASPAALWGGVARKP